MLNTDTATRQPVRTSPTVVATAPVVSDRDIDTILTMESEDFAASLTTPITD